MTVYEFLELTFIEKKNALKKGNWIANRSHSRGICKLYVLNDFFVEVLYNYDEDKILKLRPLVFIDSFEPYLAQISIDDLNN